MGWIDFEINGPLQLFIRTDVSKESSVGYHLPRGDYQSGDARLGCQREQEKKQRRNADPPDPCSFVHGHPPCVRRRRVSLKIRAPALKKSSSSCVMDRPQRTSELARTLRATPRLRTSPAPRLRA